MLHPAPDPDLDNGFTPRSILPCRPAPDFVIVVVGGGGGGAAVSTDLITRPTPGNDALPPRGADRAGEAQQEGEESQSVAVEVASAIIFWGWFW